MPDPPPPKEPVEGPGAADRLDSWKEIAAHFRRDVTTVQRWEKREGMPVHRHLHDRTGSVFAFRAELDAWGRSRSVEPGGAGEGPTTAPPIDAGRPSRAAWRAGAAAGILAVAAAGWLLQSRRSPGENPLEGARFQKLTDFEGIEQAAAISRDGSFVAFQSDRDGRMDVWVTQIGTGRFVNLTRGAAPEIANPSVRTLGFSPDGSLVTFWARGESARDEIGIRAVPLLGGPARPYLEGAAEFDWSHDGGRLLYHTTAPGDPMLVRDASRQGEVRALFSAPPGLHAHFPVFSPDDAFAYFIQGSLPDHMDLWRIRSTGGTPEQVTRHDSTVTFPVFLDARTLLYLATDPDGSGPWIYGLDVERQATRRISPGVDSYTSLAASADGRRVVATLASPKTTLWRVPLAGTKADVANARRVALTTANGTSPRLGPGYLLYVSSKGEGDGIWKLREGTATELWSAPGARIVGAPGIRRDGSRIAFSARQKGRPVVYVVNGDGTRARVVTKDLEVQGAPAWAPDGESLAVTAVADGVPRLFRLWLDGRPPAPFVAGSSFDAAWSSDGNLVAFSGADVGTTFPVRVLRADGGAYSGPSLTLTRGSRRLAFLPSGKSLVVLRGELTHKDLWAVDLETGGESRMTEVPSDFDVRDFDVSPDGTEIVLERAQESSDLVLIERPRR